MEIDPVQGPRTATLVATRDEARMPKVTDARPPARALPAGLLVAGESARIGRRPILAPRTKRELGVNTPKVAPVAFSPTHERYTRVSTNSPTSGRPTKRAAASAPTVALFARTPVFL